MTTLRTDDPDLRAVFAASVLSGEFASEDAAEADFWMKLKGAAAEADRGELHDIETVRRSLHERYANWPRAAE